MKIHQPNAGHMTKMAAMPIYGKNPLSRNHWADFDETLYKVSETYALYYCANYDPGLTLTYFTARSNLQLRLYMGKCDFDGFFGIYCIL